jgi:glycosyltransferase involved in cell wall biosynthesis
MTHCCDGARAYFRGVTDIGSSSSAGENDVPAVPAVTRLALVTDAWHPQTNGVVNTLSRLERYLKHVGVDVLVVTSDGHRTMPLPFYGDVRVACDPWKAIPRMRGFKPHAVHIATEGPLGIWTRLWLARRRVEFTTGFHTRFPEYLRARVPIPVDWTYAAERWFHGRATATMVGTVSLIQELQRRGVGRRLVHWPRGVDDELFHPAKRRDDVYDYPRPVWLYVGRVAVEKSLEDFLSLDLPGTKVVVGDGPAREGLQRRFPATIWRGWRHGEDLAAHFASADCFVFPSRTETFGNVILEAMASGLPVASVPSPGPIDLIEDGRNGAVGSSVYESCLRAFRCSGEAARMTARRYTWRASHDLFRSYLVPMGVPID